MYGRVLTGSQKAGQDAPVRKRWNPLTQRQLAVEVGSRIRGARQSRGWSEKILASKLEIQEKLLVRYEAGNLLPRLYTLYQLAGALEIDLGYFLSDLPAKSSSALVSTDLNGYLKSRRELTNQDQVAIGRFLGIFFSRWEFLRAPKRKQGRA